MNQCMGKAGEYLEDATVDDDLNASFSDNAAEDGRAAAELTP